MNFSSTLFKSILLSSALTIWFASALADSAEQISPLTLMQLQAKEPALIIDIRRTDEWQADGMMPDSAGLTFFDAEGHFNATEFSEQVEKLKTHPDQPVILVCQRGNRSAKAARLLREIQPDKVIYDLAGGIDNWRRNINTTSTDSAHGR